MALELLSGIGPLESCPYLPEETARFAYRYYSEIPVADYESLLAAGWRRQGMCFFRPACPGCGECRSLRVDVAAFRPSKSQRRCLRRNQDVRLIVRRPAISRRQMALFHAYHSDMHRRRGWERDFSGPSDYARSFLSGVFPFAREFAYYDGEELVAVGLVDITPTALSSVYFYHDPTWRDRGLGTFSILKELEFAREHRRRWLYLGYWIPANPSMAYKSRFGPHELLDRYIDENERPEWSASWDDDAP